MITMRLPLRVSPARVRALREVGAVLGSLALLAACSTETAKSEECYPGDYQVVTLPNGTTEYYVCSADAGAYVPNDGSNPNALPDANEPDTSLPDGGSSAPPTTCTPGDLGFMCAGCTTNADCAPGLGLVCFPFPNKGGNLCTLDCPGNPCPPPSAGCGNNGHCKP